MENNSGSKCSLRHDKASAFVTSRERSKRYAYALGEACASGATRSIDRGRAALRGCIGPPAGAVVRAGALSVQPPATEHVIVPVPIVAQSTAIAPVGNGPTIVQPGPIVTTPVIVPEHVCVNWIHGFAVDVNVIEAVPVKLPASVTK